jgi:metallo-beta-lactamase family protein
MADGGRIVEHLTRSLGNRKNAVLFVGFQAEGTLGRALVEGSKEVEIGKTKFPVRAKIHYFHGFSAHGDTNDYIAWIKRFNSEKLKKVFMVHAEPERAEALTHEFEAIGIQNTHIPGWKETVQL